MIAIVDPVSAPMAAINRDFAAGSENWEEVHGVLRGEHSNGRCRNEHIGDGPDTRFDEGHREDGGSVRTGVECASVFKSAGSRGGVAEQQSSERTDAADVRLSEQSLVDLAAAIPDSGWAGDRQSFAVPVTTRK